MSTVDINNAPVELLLPHRDPFLLVDEILEVHASDYIKVLKRVNEDDPVFKGHFPGFPVYPGVLIIEAMAQASGLLITHTTGELSVETDKLYYFAGIEKARFKGMVKPGDELVLKVEYVSEKGNFTVVKTRGTAMVDGNIVASADLLFSRKN